MVMRLRKNAPDWTANFNPEKQAKCISFPPSRGNDPWYDEQDEAIQICNGDNDGVVCPMRHECLMFALTNNEAHGVWGGMYLEDRTRLRRFIKKKDWKWHPPTVVPVSQPDD